MTTQKTMQERHAQTLPKGWRWETLQNLGQFEAGGTPPKGEELFWGGSIPFVTGADITDLYITTKHARAFLTEAGLQSDKTVICQPGTVLIVTRTRVGRAGIAREIMGASQDITAFKCGKEICAEFLTRYLHSIGTYLIDSCRGSTIQGLTRDVVANIYCPVPPLDDQKRIAAILNEQMAAVEKARKAAEARLEAAKTLPSAFLRNVFPQPRQPVPEGWEWLRLGEMCEAIDYGFTASAKPIIEHPKFLRITDIQNGAVEWDKVPGCEIAETDEESYRLRDGDIVFARTGATTGKSFLIKGPPRSVFASYLIRVRAKLDTVDPFFLSTYFLSPGYWEQVLAGIRGGAQGGFNASMLKKLVVPLPALSRQRDIAAFLNEQMAVIEKAHAATEAELEAINTIPSALLRRAFNGDL